MPEIRRAAIPIQQGKRTLFLTSFTVRDFLSSGFYQVDRLDVQESTGTQRILNESRAQRFGRDMNEADEADEAFLPTSVFLATSGRISYDEQHKELYFDSDQHHGICPFDVVDGQHRIEGLKSAVAKNKRLLDFPMAVVVAHGMLETEKMLQFITVNVKQEKVNKGVAQHITARFTKMEGIEDMPHLPSWLRKDVERGTDDEGLTIARHLNSRSESPWHGRIQFADESRKKRHTVNQSTFVAATKRIILNKFHPYMTQLSSGKRLPVLDNYWGAVEEVFAPDSRGSDGRAAPVVYKSMGLEFFLSISATVMSLLAPERSFTQPRMVKLLQDAGDYLDPESWSVVTPEFWMPGHEASSQNRAGIQQLASRYSEAMRAAAEEEIEI